MALVTFIFVADTPLARGGPAQKSVSQFQKVTQPAPPTRGEGGIRLHYEEAWLQQQAEQAPTSSVVIH